MFWIKKSSKNEDLGHEERIKKVEKRILQLESEMLGMMVAMDTIRSRVLKKIKIQSPNLDDGKEKDLYNGVLLTEQWGY